MGSLKFTPRYEEGINFDGFYWWGSIDCVCLVPVAPDGTCNDKFGGDYFRRMGDYKETRAVVLPRYIVEKSGPCWCIWDTREHKRVLGEWDSKAAAVKECEKLNAN